MSEYVLSDEVIRLLCERAHANSTEKGFWESTNIAEKLALIHSEVSEALEAIRKPDRGNIGEELADVCIRVFDLAAYLRIDLGDEIERKMAFNKTRPHKHGKVF